MEQRDRRHPHVIEGNEVEAFLPLLPPPAVAVRRRLLLARPVAQQQAADLLAIEQNAWVLAGRDKRCVVVGTRTELDWAMKNDQICVWAPSKIVLDAVDGPSAQAADALALVAWFAGQMQALELVVIGDDAPICNVPVRTL